MPSIEADPASKLAGLQIDFLTKYRAGLFTLEEFEWYLGLKTEERKKLMGGIESHLLSAVIPPPAPIDPLIRVDRKVKPAYPDWAKKVMHQDLELTGPPEFDVSTLDPWLHPKQKTGVIRGHDLYKHLKKHEMLEGCLGLADLLAIQAKGIDFFRRYFAGKEVFGWKSVVRYRDLDGRLNVPCLYERGDKVVLGWGWLDYGWGSVSPALRFAK